MLGKSVPVFKKRSSAKLRVRTGNQSKVISDVLSGTAHIGITPMETSHESLISSPYTRVGQIVVMPTTHPLASKRKLKIEHLQGQALIVPPEDKPHRILINRLLMSAQIDWQVAVEVNGWELMLHFAKQGMGLAIVNEYCKVPKGLTARALPEFPSIQFQLIKRRFGSTRPAIAELEEILFSHKESWKNEHRQR
ncbi:MAG: LysR family transcriptional regulator substrate-binding protein [Pseudomonadales bacterium]|nr:LysR family transcriptional regulator substrate-binding protein [Pseudomonadales bacterium]